MKHFFLIIIAFLLAANMNAQFRPLKKRHHNVNKILKEIVTSSDFKNAGFTFLAVDLKSGKTIAEVNSDKALRPASTLKLLTTATALELLGPNYRFITNLEYSGKIDTLHHLLNGNIIIKGGGDPTLGSKYFETTKTKQFLTQWGQAVNQLGIDSINGQVIGDASIYSSNILPPTWSWQNMGNYYGAGPCGLTIFDNSYTVCFNTGNRVGDTVKQTGIYPTIPLLSIENRVTADTINYDNSYIYGAPYCNTRIIEGQLPLGKNHFCVKGSIPDPAFAASWQLDSALNANGIITSRLPVTQRLLSKNNKYPLNTQNTFYKIYSPTLSEIIAQTNIRSINLFAEHLAISAGIILGSQPETTAAVDSIVSYWTKKGMDTQGLSIHDGSGLSQYDVITARQMVFILSYMKMKSQNFETYYRSLAIAGLSGTLEDMFINTSAQGNIRAKSGTIDGAKAYAGYVTTKSGRDVVFSIIVNNFSCSSKDAKVKLEKLITALADFTK